MSEAPDRLSTLTAARSPLPDWPPGWYTVAREADFPPGVVRGVKLGESEIVVFRTKAGAYGAVDAHCPHMGAHLSHGKVVGEYLECALHCWRIGTDGKVADRSARTNRWAVREHYGFVLIGLDAGAAPPLAGETEFVWTSVNPINLDVSWHGLMANAFDMPHLCTVHRRALRAPPEITVEPGRSFTLHYVSRVTGSGLSDRIMKWLSRDRIDVRLTCLGTVFVVNTDLGFTRTAAFVGLLPTDRGTRLHAAFGIRPGPFMSLRLALTRWLFVAFLRRDVGVVEGMRLRLDIEDDTLQALFTFLRTLRHPRK